MERNEQTIDPERVRQIFRNRFDYLREGHARTWRLELSYAMQEIGALYSEIFNISCEQAAEELCGGDDNG
ncbi:MAG: hypothetical protein NC299_16780 [Lachnospiraceae bacterium]|nr:hypothetical protein [Lachnospiraceae bacterium]